MRRYVTLIISLLLSPALFAQSSAALSREELLVSRKRNLLVVVASDLGCDLGCYGDTVARTPNLDRFAEQSILHESLFTTVASLTPSFYAFSTGRYPSVDGANYGHTPPFDHFRGVVPPAGVRGYSEYLRRYGYFCASNMLRSSVLRLPTVSWDIVGPAAHWSKAPDDKPFFSIVALDQCLEMNLHAPDTLALRTTEQVVVPPYYPDTELVREAIAHKYANIERLDSAFGAILEELERSERGRNTIVIFLSLNGGPLPRVKYELSDEATRLPFLLRYPDGEGAGRRSDEIMMLCDIPPTLLSLVGLSTPDYMHGIAQYGYYRFQGRRQYAYGAIDRSGRVEVKRASIRDKDYLYIRNYMPQQSLYRDVLYRKRLPMMTELEQMNVDGALDAIQGAWFDVPAPFEELYDRKKDPYNIHNLALDPRHKRTLYKMRREYQSRWIERLNMAWDSDGESYFAHKMWPSGELDQCEPLRYMVMDGLLYVTNDLLIYTASYRRKGSYRWQLYREAVPIERGEQIEVRLERTGLLGTVTTVVR